MIPAMSSDKKPLFIEEYSLDDLLEWSTQDLETLDIRRLGHTEPIVVARFLERLNLDQRRDVLRGLSTEHASAILSQMAAEQSAEVVGSMREERAVGILEDFEPDDAADVVAELNEDDRQRLLKKLEPETAKTVRNLLTYDADTAGGVMTPLMAKVDDNMLVDAAIDTIREQSKNLEDVNYIYVVDQEQHLRGIVSIRQLLLAGPKQKIAEIMNDRVKGVFHPEADKEEVALALAELNLLSLPIVDEENRLLGIVTVDDVIDILKAEATEDIQKFVGAGGDESIHDKMGFSLKKRQPWLQINLLTALLASVVVYFFRNEIEQVAMLAVLMPIIASMGSNSGAQTLAIAIRSLALGEIEPKDHRRLYLKESFLGLINGLFTGIACALLTFLFSQDVIMSLIVWVALILNMGLAGLAGAFIPLLLKRWNLDPAQSSYIFLTTISDVGGFFVFLALGAWLLL